MEEEKKLSVSNMVRLTAENSGKFWSEVAEHIERLEATVVSLNNKISELESKSDEA